MIKSAEESATHPVPEARAFGPRDEDLAETVRIDADMLASIDMDLSGTFPPHQLDLPDLPKPKVAAEPRTPQKPAVVVDAGVSPLWFVAGGVMLLAAAVVTMAAVVLV